MIEHTLFRLERLISTLPTQIDQLSEDDFTAKKAAGSWSKKEILGHLIDSASNNHHRFIKAQYEDRPLISYDQDKWVDENDYQSANKQDLIVFWLALNKHLLRLLQNMPPQKLAKTCRLPNDLQVNLSDLFIDYVDHLEHHVAQLIRN